MKSKALETKLKEVKNLEKRIKLLKNLQKTIQEMNKLNSCFDLNEILMNEPKFNDDFYNETLNWIAYLEKSIDFLTE